MKIKKVNQCEQEEEEVWGRGRKKEIYEEIIQQIIFLINRNAELIKKFFVRNLNCQLEVRLLIKIFFEIPSGNKAEVM